MADDWKWGFLGFKSPDEECPVQIWFDRLCDEDKEAIVDTLLYLEKIIDRRWPEQSFDPLVGAGGISEIKIAEFRSERNGIAQRITLRIYGFFGPVNYKRSYTFLHGTDKKIRNDREGKSLAKRRLDAILQGDADVHKFSV
jgi:hypothetical protein